MQNCDVMHIHGKMDKDDKFASINLFCGNVIVDGFNPRCLVTTASSDLGVNHPNAQFILNLEWTDSIATFAQRMGRASRAGQESQFVLVAGISSYLAMVRRITGSSDDTTSNDNSTSDDDPCRGQETSMLIVSSSKKDIKA